MNNFNGIDILIGQWK